MSTDKFIKSMVTALDDEYTSVASDGVGAAEFSGCVDTGCYMLNAVLSGSIYGGVPNNKITAFAGESSTGKTFFVLGIARSFLKSNPNAILVYYDTEAAVTKEMMESRGIDTKRVIVSEPETIQRFRHHAIKLLDKYIASENRPPMMIILDSLGMMSTTKELEDSSEGKETKDMTKAQTIKAAFRVLSLKLAKAKVPLLVTNHTYSVVGAYVPTQEMSGGSGLKYAATTIATLSKKKDKDGTDVVGNIIKVKMYKSRLSKENSTVELRLSYDKGLDKYYGLLSLAEKAGLVKRIANKYEFPNGEKAFEKHINASPGKYFTEEVLRLLDEHARKEFSYGGATGEPDKIEEEVSSQED